MRKASGLSTSSSNQYLMRKWKSMTKGPGKEPAEVVVKTGTRLEQHISANICSAIKAARCLPVGVSLHNQVMITRPMHKALPKHVAVACLATATRATDMVLDAPRDAPTLRKQKTMGHVLAHHGGASVET